MRSNLQAKSRPYIFASPSWIVIMLIVVFPIIYTIYISFTNFNIYHWTNYRLIGGSNYLTALTAVGKGGFASALGCTIIWTVVNMALQIVIAVTLALMLNVKGLKFSGLYKTLLMVPWAMPGYISAIIWRNGMFHYDFGLISYALRGLGLEPVDWLNHSVPAFIACMMVNLWLALPFMILVVYGGLQSIDNAYYEMAEMEGAGLITRITKITIPLLKPILFPAAILTALLTFKQFDIFFLLTMQRGAKTGANINTVLTYVYENVFITSNYGYSAAVSAIIFIIITFFVAASRKYLREKGEVY